MEQTQQPKKKRASGRRKTKSEKQDELRKEVTTIIDGTSVHTVSVELGSHVEAYLASRNASETEKNEIISLTQSELENEKIRAIAEAYLETRKDEPAVITGTEDNRTDEEVYGRNLTIEECKSMIESDKFGSLEERISKFVASMKGKPRATNAEITVMYGLYFELTGITERDKTCSVCVMRVYKRLKSESEKKK